MGETMNNKKVKWTVSVAFPLARFLERYQKNHNLATRSEALEQAIKLLQDRELEREYAESALEDDAIWDNALKDGLTPALW
jgi:cell division protein FtsB